MMRLRSSLRCSKKVIAPAGSSGGAVICVLDSNSGTDSGRGLVVIERFLGTRDGSALGTAFGRLFRGAWNRFGCRGNHRVFRGAEFWLSLGGGRFCTTSPGCRTRQAVLGC